MAQGYREFQLKLKEILKLNKFKLIKNFTIYYIFISFII